MPLIERVRHDYSCGAMMSSVKSSASVILLFESPEQAALAYNQVAKKLHGDFAALNSVSNS